MPAAYEHGYIEKGHPIDAGSLTLVVVGLLALVSVRVVAIAHWDYGLARSILSGVSFQDLPALVVGVLFSNIHATTLLLAAVAAYFFVGSLTHGGAMARWAVALAVLFALFGVRNIFVSHEARDAIIGMIVVSTAGFVFVVAEVIAVIGGSGYVVPLGQLAAVVMAMIASVAIATDTTPWKPRERLVVKNELVPGWVVGESQDSQWLRVLTDEQPRALRLIRISEVSDRALIP